MEPKETLQFIVDRFKIDLNQPNPIAVNMSRFHHVAPMLNDLKFKKAVELGVYKGVFTQILARRAPNMWLMAVDAWTTYDGYKDYPPGDLETVGWNQAVERCFRYPNVQMIKAWSKDAVLTFPDASLDYLFIDANHTYECVKEDLGLWTKKVKPGGIVMGHDYLDTSKHGRLKDLDFGVIQAVNEHVAENNIAHLFITIDGYPSWFYVQGDTK